MLLDLKIIAGIASYKDFLFSLKQSNAPAFTKPSNCNLFMSLVSILLTKSCKDLNFPFFKRSFTILLIASYPTALIEPKA